MELDGKQVLVTGGAGFIGSHVIQRLLDEGATVDTVDNLFVGHRSLISEDATLHESDIRSEELPTIVSTLNPDIIIHLAALHYIPYCNEHPEETFEVNVMGTRRVLESAASLDGLERFVYASTAAVYPPQDRPHAETDGMGPMDIYGRTKLIGEDLVKLFHERTGVPAVSARLFNVYGPNETNDHLIPAILDQLRDGSREIELGNLTPARDLIHVDDVTRAVLAMAVEFDGGYRAYNIGTGTEHTVRAVAERVGDALDENLDVSQAQKRVRESDRPHLHASTDRIERELGWQPQVEFVDGLRRLLAAEGIAR